MANYDILGNIAILKFSRGAGKEEKLKAAERMLKIPSVRTVLEKTKKVSGRLRTIRTRHLLGEKTKIAEYKENGCIFRLKVDSCYFSPRLANERLVVARMVKRGDDVLVMFSGVAPFPIVIAKHSKPDRIVAVELGKECCKYAEQNLRLNKIYSGVEIIQGDVKKVIPKLKEKYDVIVMPRPNLKETFLKEAFAASKKGTRIIYYGFAPESKLLKMLDDLHKESRKLKRKIKILNVKEAGDIAPYEHRYRVEMKVL